MKRRLLNFLALVSVLLCVGTCALWAWSYWDGRTFWLSSLWVDGPVYRDRRLAINYWDGRLVLTRWHGRYVPTPGREALFRQNWSQAWGRPFWAAERPTHDLVFTDPAWGFAGLEQQRTTLGEGTSRHVVDSLAVPLWMPAALFAAVSAWVVLRRRRVLAAGRIARGLCPVCAYDLRASPDKCPECGMMAAAPPSR